MVFRVSWRSLGEEAYKLYPIGLLEPFFMVEGNTFIRVSKGVRLNAVSNHIRVLTLW